MIVLKAWVKSTSHTYQRLSSDLLVNFGSREPREIMRRSQRRVCVHKFQCSAPFRALLEALIRFLGDRLKLS